MYDLLVQNYVVDYSQYLDSVDFLFEFPDTITFEAVVEDGSFQRKGESYVQATNCLLYTSHAVTDPLSVDFSGVVSDFATGKVAMIMGLNGYQPMIDDVAPDLSLIHI